MNYESDTPETDIECFIYEGDYVPASFARQLERERDEARKERNAALSDRDAWARLCGAVDCYSPSTAEPYEELKLQRDALRAELAKYTTDSGDSAQRLSGPKQKPLRNTKRTE